mgnify:CR=1 FL=1
MKNRLFFMKKIIIFIAIATTINLNAQYAIVENKIVLPAFVSNNDRFQNQLDSVLFIKKSCFSPSDRRIKRGYVFFTRIKEPVSGYYLISIVYGKPSWVENDINTGIYILKDYYFIIRDESSQTPLFEAIEKNIIFKYEKELRKRNNKEDSYYYDELTYPEEFCGWFLSFSENRLKIISRDEYFADPK